MISYESAWRIAVRRFVVRVGVEPLKSCLNCIFVIHGQQREKTCELYFSVIREFRERIEKVLDENTALSLQDLAINGRDLLQEGYKGKIIENIKRLIFNCYRKSFCNKKLSCCKGQKSFIKEIFKTSLFPYSLHDVPHRGFRWPFFERSLCHFVKLL